METITIRRRDGPSIDVRISEYVTILTNPVRWEIVRLLDTEPMDIELISSMLYRKRVTQRPLSRQAIEKHIQQLTKIGVLMKRPGVKREDNRGLSSLMEREGIVRTRGQNVSLYAVVPEGIETVLRSLDTLGNYRVRVELMPKVERVKGDYEEFVNSFYRMRVLNGEDAGRLFRLRNDSIRIGRIDAKAENEYDLQHDIALSQKYAAVSRVWRPHARLIREGDAWLIEHCEGTNGTYVDNMPLERHEKKKLEDHDVVDLALGEGGARLVFLDPEPK